MTTLHNLGFPRIGARRELKQAVEAYWAGTLQQSELEHADLASLIASPILTSSVVSNA